MSTGGFNAGDVYVGAELRIDEASFRKWDETYKRAEAKPDIRKTAKVDVKGDRDLDRMNTELERTERDADRAGASVVSFRKGLVGARDEVKKMAKDSDGLTFKLGGMAGKLTTLVRTLALFTPALYAAGSSIVALAGSLSQAALGMGALGVAAGGVAATTLPLLIGTMAKFKDVTKAVQDVQKAHDEQTIKNDKSLKGLSATAAATVLELRNMTRAERDLVKQLGEGQKAFDRMIGPGRDHIFEGMARSIAVLRPTLGRFRQDFADLGDVIEKKMIGAAESLARPNGPGKQLETLLSSADELAGIAADALGDLGEIGLNIANEALPRLIGALKDVRRWLDGVVDTTGKDSFGDEVDKWIDSTEKWIGLFKDAGDLIATVLGSGADEGDKMVDTLDRMVKRWDDFLESDEGQRQLRKFFQDGRRLLGQMVEFIKGFAIGVKDTAERFRPLAHLFAQIATHVTGIDKGSGGVERIGKVLGAIALLKLTGATRLFSLMATVGNKSGAVQAALRALTNGRFGNTTNNVVKELAERGKTPAAPLYVFVVNEMPGGGGTTPAGGGVSEEKRVLGPDGKPLPRSEAAPRPGDAFQRVQPGERPPSLPKPLTPPEAVGVRGVAGAAGRVATKAVAGLTGYLAIAELINATMPKLDTFTDKLQQLADTPQGADSPRGKQLRNLASDLQNAVKTADPQKLAAASRGIGDLARTANTPMTKNNLSTLAGEVRKAANDVAWSRLKGVLKDERDAFRHLSSDGKVTLGELRKTVASNLSEIRKRLGTDTEAGKAAASKNFHDAQKAIEKAMKAGTISTQKGTAEIHRLMVANLKVYGFTEKQAVAELKPGTRFDSGPDEGTRGVGHAGGGYAEPEGTGSWLAAATGFIGRVGEKGRDTVKAILGRGEAVLNRHQQSIVNSALRKSGIPGLRGVFGLTRGSKHYMAEGGIAGDAQPFAEGGSVGAATAAANAVDSKHFPYHWGGGHEQPARFEPFDCSGAVSYVLQRAGIGIPTMVAQQFMSAGKPGPGPISIFAKPSHVIMRIGQRFFGTGMGNPGGGAGWGNPSASYLKTFPAVRHFDASGGGGGLGGDIKAPVVQGGGLIGKLAQGALNMVAAGANRRIQDTIAAMGMGGDDGEFAALSPDADVVSSFRQAIESSHANETEQLALWEAGLVESGLRNLNYGDRDSLGSLQERTSIYGAGHAMNPLASALRFLRQARGHRPWSGTPGMLAQEVQGSAFPGRYDAVEGQARHYLAEGGWVEAADGLLQEGGGIHDPFAPGTRPANQSSTHTGTTATKADPYNLRTLKSLNTDRIGDYDDLLTANDHDVKLYEARDRRFGLTTEEFIDPQTGLINQAAIEHRAGELSQLLAIRKRILARLKKAREIAQRIIRSYETMIKRLRRSLKHAKKKERTGIKKQIKTYEGRVAGWKSTLSEDLRFDILAAEDDVTEIMNEGHELRGIVSNPVDTGAGTDPGAGADTGTGATDTTPDVDLQALSDQQASVIAGLRKDVTARDLNYAAITGPGDLGTGQGATALQSARLGLPAGGIDLSGVVPSTGPAGLAGATGGNVYVSVESQSLVAGGPTELAAIGGAVGAAVDSQLPKNTRGISVG